MKRKFKSDLGILSSLTGNVNVLCKTMYIYIQIYIPIQLSIYVYMAHTFSSCVLFFLCDTHFRAIHDFRLFFKVVTVQWMLVRLDFDWSKKLPGAHYASFIRQDESNPQAPKGVVLSQDIESLIQTTLLSRVGLTLVSLLQMRPALDSSHLMTRLFWIYWSTRLPFFLSFSFTRGLDENFL